MHRSVLDGCVCTHASTHTRFSINSHTHRIAVGGSAKRRGVAAIDWGAILGHAHAVAQGASVGEVGVSMSVVGRVGATKVLLGVAVHQASRVTAHRFNKHLHVCASCVHLSARASVTQSSNRQERWIIHTCKINATSINVFMIERVYRLNQQPNTIQLYLLGIWALGAVESIIAEGEILAGKQLLDRIKVEALFQHTDVVLSAIENLCDLSAWIVCVRAHTHALSLMASSTSTVTVFPSAPLTSVWPTVSISISGKSSADLISEMLLVYSKILSVTCVNEFALMRPPVVCLSCALCCLL